MLIIFHEMKDDIQEPEYPNFYACIFACYTYIPFSVALGYIDGGRSR